MTTKEEELKESVSDKLKIKRLQVASAYKEPDEARRKYLLDRSDELFTIYLMKLINSELVKQKEEMLGIVDEEAKNLRTKFIDDIVDAYKKGIEEGIQSILQQQQTNHKVE